MARHDVRSEPVRFRAGSDLFAACLYRPLLVGPQPGLLVVQEGWELDNQAKGVAERLGHVGYVTLALDARPGELELPPAGAPSARAEQILRAALTWLRGRTFVKNGIAGSIGFGAGGGLALLLATGADPVQAAVSIYGDTGTLSRVAGGVLAPLLVVEAGPPRQAAERRLREALSAAGLPHEFVRYPLAERGFFDERMPAFRPDDAEDAWSRANKFFYRHLGEPG